MQDPLAFRIGIGYDNHRLVEGRPLILGGVEIPAPVGADAHSDGDVVLHALVDALLGAVADGDIGSHFPDSDPRWKDQPSRVFLEEAARRVKEKGYRIVNIDTNIILERIRLGERKSVIAQSLRTLLGSWFRLDPGAVSVKAKTNERCDAIGEGRAVAAQAVVLLARDEGSPA